MSKPLVSVLIPTYNGARFLARTLASARAQTHRELEILVGDDASTDETPEIIAAAAAADPRIRVLRHETNLGPAGNPQQLLREARGDFVKFLLHDDLLHPTCVALLLRGMRSPSISLAFSHRRAVDADGQEIPHIQFEHLAAQPGPLSGRKLGNATLLGLKNVVGEVTTCLFRRADVDPDQLWSVDGRRLQALGDLALWLDLLRRGDAWYEPGTLSSFRFHADQQSTLPRVKALASRDWPLLIDWACRSGYLAGPGQEAQAHTQAMINAGAVHLSFLGAPDGAVALQAAWLSLARLVELRREVDGAAEPLVDRAHTGAVLAGFGQELDVWGRVHEQALAAPTCEPAEVAATVQTFRLLRDEGRARSFFLTAPAEHLPRVAELTAAAVADGEDIDVEVFPSTVPADLLTPDVLAVAPRGARWHDGRSAVWTFETAAGSADYPSTALGG